MDKFGLIPNMFPSTTLELLDERLFLVEWRVSIDTPEVRSVWYPAQKESGLPLPPLHLPLIEKKGLFCAGGRGAARACNRAQRTLSHPLRPAAHEDARGYRWHWGQWLRLSCSGRWIATGYNTGVRHHAWLHAVPLEG